MDHPACRPWRTWGGRGTARRPGARRRALSAPPAPRAGAGGPKGGRPAGAVLPAEPGAVQPGWITPWLLWAGLCTLPTRGGVVHVSLRANGERCDTPAMCAFQRGVFVANLACHTGGAAWTALVRGVHMLWVSDLLVWSVRRRWCHALRRQFRGRALRAAAPALRARLPPGCAGPCARGCSACDGGVPAALRVAAAGLQVPCVWAS